MTFLFSNHTKFQKQELDLGGDKQAQLLRCNPLTLPAQTAVPVLTLFQISQRSSFQLSESSCMLLYFPLQGLGFILESQITSSCSLIQPTTASLRDS